MAKIAIMGLRKHQQTAVSVLHDMEVLQLEPLSKDVSAILKNERDEELTRKVSDELLRMKALMTVLPGIPVIARKRFDSVDDLLQTASTIDIDEKVAAIFLATIPLLPTPVITNFPFSKEHFSKIDKACSTCVSSTFLEAL